MTTFTIELNAQNAIEIFSRIQHMPYSLLLDSADENHPDARYSFVACAPIETIEAKNGITVITNAQKQKTIEESNAFNIVQKRLKHYRLSALHNPDLPPFQGGAAGFFGYDLGRTLEDLPETAEENPEMPDMTIGIYDQVFAWDHQAQKGTLITQAENPEKAHIKQQFFLKIIEEAPNTPAFTAFDPEWKSNFTPDEYKNKINRIINYIHAGDIFQANMTQRFDADMPHGFDAFSHYLNMREVSPAPFSSFFNLGNIKISSASPERFLTTQNGIVETKPIKGTRPHLPDDPCMDQLHRNSLENSDKDRAENIMIVDLLRNDLSKVCRADSVEILKLCALETFSNVHHLVSTIQAKLRQGYDAIDLLKACFPGGSITGAPKIRSMEIIEELEPTRRGPYCGSIGYIGFDGSMDTNILIRTLVYQDNTVSFQVGGGIVADSKHDEEYQETLDKASGLFKSFTEGGVTDKKKAAA